MTRSSPEQVALGKVRTDEMRAILTSSATRRSKTHASNRTAAFKSAEQSRRETTASPRRDRDRARERHLDRARSRESDAPARRSARGHGKARAVPDAPGSSRRARRRRSKLGEDGALLYEKDASLRRTLAEREETLEHLTRANAELAARDEAQRAYAEFVRQLKTLDVSALSTSGLRGLVRLAGAHVGAVFLFDSRRRLVPVHAFTVDGRALDTRLFGEQGFAAERHRVARADCLEASALGDGAPELDLGVASAHRLGARAAHRGRRSRSGRDAPRRSRARRSPIAKKPCATPRASSPAACTTRGRTMRLARRA